MTSFEKSTKLRSIRYDLRGPVLENAERLAAQGVSIIKLNTGNPGAFGFDPPAAVLGAVAANLDKATPYSETKGILEAREAIAAYYRKRGIKAEADDVFLGNGVSEMIHMCVQALVSDGDEVLVPMPDYPLWTASVKLFGGKAVHYICDESSHWCPDIEDIKSKITSRTKAIAVINPNNPTGVLYPREVCEQIAQLAREHNLIIFADEIYESLVMDGKTHTPMAVLAPDLFVVTMCGLSKSHNLTGYRVGWICLCGNKAAAADYIQGINMLASMRLCSNLPGQYAVKPALEDFSETAAMLSPGGRIYEQRKIIVDAIDSIPGLSTVKPDAAFYIFPKIDTKRFKIEDDERFVLDFLLSKHILLVNGRGFNWREPDHFRIVYLPECEQLNTVADGLRDFLTDYVQQ